MRLFTLLSKFLSSPFDIDCEEILLPLQMKFIDLWCSENLKPKFLAFHILCENHLLPSGQFPNLTGGCPRGVMVKAMDCGIVVSEFVFQSRYYVHFRANTLGKGMNPLILPAMG